MSLKVFLVGEGPNDIGRWFFEKTYRDSKGGDGVIGALARRQVEEGWHVEDGRAWKKLSVLTVGGGLDVDEKRFNIAKQLTREADCDVLLYARDVDGDEERKALLVSLREANTEVGLAVVDPCIEGWLLELRGERKKHGWTKAGSQKALGDLTTSEMEAIVSQWDRKAEQLSEDLRRWLAEVARLLAARVETT